MDFDKQIREEVKLKSNPDYKAAKRKDLALQHGLGIDPGVAIFDTTAFGERDNTVLELPTPYEESNSLGLCDMEQLEEPDALSSIRQ